MTNERNNERWTQRLSTYKKALARLAEIIEASQERPLNDFERDGMVQRFEYTQECAWKLLKNYAEWQGAEGLGGSRDTLRKAYGLGLMDNIEAWFDMLESRNTTSHVYDEQTVRDVTDDIVFNYFPLLQDLEARFNTIITAHHEH